MYLKNIGMIAADTSRTIAYLDELINNNFLPNHVIVLLNTDSKLKPGQKNSESQDNLLNLLKKANISYSISPNSNINSNEVIEKINERQESIFIYSGFGGVLLKDGVLEAAKFLHVHGGFLPHYKGSTTNYYSLIDENTVGASSIFLTKDIDCGPVIYRENFPPPDDRTSIDHEYDSEVRAKVLIKTLRNYIEDNRFNFQLEENMGGETYYIIHPVLKHISILGS